MVLFLVCLGTNRISYAVQGAHEGGIFALCMLRDGTLVSGGGKDRKLISWNGNYQKLHKTEVNYCGPWTCSPDASAYGLESSTQCFEKIN